MKSIINYIVIVTLVLISLPILMGAEMYWDTETFTNGITLSPVTGTAGYSDSGFDTIILNTDGVVDITVEPEHRSSSQLINTTGSAPYDTLTTKYKIEFDGYVGDYTTFTDYLTFLENPATVTRPDGNSIEITLSVQVSTVPYEVPDKGSYSATQTLTVSWTGP